MADTGHIGAWGTREFGATEWLSDLLGLSRNEQGGSDINMTPEKAAAGPQPTNTQSAPNSSQSLPMSSATDPRAANYNPQPTNNPTPQPSGNNRYNELKTLADKGDLNPAQKTEWETLLEQTKGSQEDAAAKQAEANRQAAMRRYEAQSQIAGQAKESARKEYDWLTEALGSNKKDALEQIALNQEQGEADYMQQEKKTRADYDKAKQNILSTYRDLQVQQEKILRGSGMGTSSRSQEAALKLNNLMGKDLSTVTTNEADSLALIGNALTHFQKQVQLTKNQVETESQQKLDKAALDYDRQVKAIDANLTLSANEREDAYAAAEAQLAADKAKIDQWAAGLKMQAAEMFAKNKDTVDGFVSDMLDYNGGLNLSLEEKRARADKLEANMGSGLLNQNPTTEDPTVGVYQDNASYADKDALDKAYAEGRVSPAEYSRQLRQIQMSSGGTTTSIAPQVNTASTLARGMNTQQDPLLAQLFARA